MEVPTIEEPSCGRMHGVLQQLNLNLTDDLFCSPGWTTTEKDPRRTELIYYISNRSAYYVTRS
jgi:hypothetical protein